MTIPSHIVVIGGSGGIGYAIVQKLLSLFPNALVHATYHRHEPGFQAPNLKWTQLDITSPTEISQFGLQFSRVDWLINCVGMLHTPEHGPEKNIESIDGQFFLRNIEVNTLPTLLLTQAFFPAFKVSPSVKLAVISARVGSIEDNGLGGWYSYRASKAALNMVVKNLSIEMRRRLKQATVLALHPGTTDTELSKPFQTNVPEGKLFNADNVALDLLNLIANSTPSDSGQFWDYRGENIPW